MVILATLRSVWLSISWATPVAALIGGAIGAVVSVVQRINSDSFNRHLALLVISFLAGFSERFAQDALTSVLPEAKSTPAPTSAASPSSRPAPAPAPDAPPERSTS